MNDNRDVTSRDVFFFYISSCNFFFTSRLFLFLFSEKCNLNRNSLIGTTPIDPRRNPLIDQEGNALTSPLVGNSLTSPLVGNPLTVPLVGNALTDQGGKKGRRHPRRVRG